MFIDIGFYNYKLLIPLIYPITYQIKKFLINQDFSFLYQVFMNFLSYLLAGFIYLIVLYRSKKKFFRDPNDNKRDVSISGI